MGDSTLNRKLKIEQHEQKPGGGAHIPGKVKQFLFQQRIRHVVLNLVSNLVIRQQILNEIEVGMHFLIKI